MASHIISKIHMTDDGRMVTANHLRREQETALRDIIRHNRFKPLTLSDTGPYGLDLSIQEGRLVIRISSEAGQDLTSYVLSIKPYRRLIEDYFLMIGSHEKARKEGRHEKLEAIDMGRRGLHNEGAQLLMDRLGDKIEMDFETARRFFTLICALHEKHLRFMR